MTKHIIRLSIKAINDTIDPNGLVTSLLAFVVLLSFATPRSQSLNQTEQFNGLKCAKTEIETIMTQKD